MDKAGVSITFDAVAREARLSQSWLYNQPDLRAEIERLRAEKEICRDHRTPLTVTSTTLSISDCRWSMYLSMLPTERRRFLATVGRRSTNQALQRRDPDRRYPILLALVAQSAVDQLDEVVALFDRAVSARESRAKSKTDEQLIERAKRGESRQLLMDVILPVLADLAIPDEQIGGRTVTTWLLTSGNPRAILDLTG